MPAEELFDTENDPLEMVNLAGDPQYAAVLEEQPFALLRDSQLVRSVRAWLRRSMISKHGRHKLWEDHRFEGKGRHREGHKPCRRSGVGAGWTWDRYLDVARKLTVDANGDGRIDCYGCSGAYYLDAIWGNDGRIFNKDFTQTQFCSPEIRRALEFCRTFYKERIVPLEMATYYTDSSLFDPLVLFKSGKMAMRWGGTWPTQVPVQSAPVRQGSPP